MLPSAHTSSEHLETQHSPKHKSTKPCKNAQQKTGKNIKQNVLPGEEEQVDMERKDREDLLAAVGTEQDALIHDNVDINTTRRNLWDSKTLETVLFCVFNIAGQHILQTEGQNTSLSTFTALQSQPDKC